MVARIRPWFAATAVAAAALLVGFTVARFAPVKYAASGRLHVPAAASQSLEESWPDASLLNRWLAQPLTVRPTVVSSAHRDRQSPRHVLVVAQASTGGDAAESVNRVLEAAHADLNARGLRFAQERHRSLLTMLHHARAERNRAQRELDRFIAKRMAQPVAAPPATAAPEPASAIASSAPLAPRRNPLWDDLVRQVGELEGRRAGLLLTMTSAHPVIRDLDWRLAQLREQLRLSQEFVAAPEPNVVQPLPAIPTADGTAPSTPAATVEDDQALRQLRKRLSAADRQLGFAVQQERAASQELSALRAELHSCLTPAVVPLQPIDAALRDRIRWSGAILALGLAAATVRLLAPRRQVLRTTDDVHRRLGLPVLGKLSIR